jgi:N-acetylneuraminic acid mutarotase
MVFGGASASLSPATTTVQALSGSPSSISSGPTVPTSTTIGTLPQPRAAATALTVGTSTYLVGGEGTAGPDAAVLATSDGRHFVTVASLPIPVQFPAVAAVGHRLYVFGGVAVTGAEAGRPVNAIQVVDLKTHKVTAAGHLPEPLTASAAVVLGHDVLLAGGDTTSGGAGASTAGSTPTMSVSTVWSFDPTSETCTPVGHLSVAVSHAGVAVLGSTAWLVGGESNGTPVSSVQSFVTAPSLPSRSPRSR